MYCSLIYRRYIAKKGMLHKHTFKKKFLDEKLKFFESDLEILSLNTLNFWTRLP